MLLTCLRLDIALYVHTRSYYVLMAYAHVHAFYCVGKHTSAHVSHFLCTHSFIAHIEQLDVLSEYCMHQCVHPLFIFLISEQLQRYYLVYGKFLD